MQKKTFMELVKASDEVRFFEYANMQNCQIKITDHDKEHILSEKDGKLFIQESNSNINFEILSAENINYEWERNGDCIHRYTRVQVKEV